MSLLSFFGRDKSKKFLDEVLTDKELNLITQFADNPEMREAVKKLFLTGIYYNGTLQKGLSPEPLINWALIDPLSNTREYTDEILGQKLRGKAKGIEMLEQAFFQLDTYKTKKEKEKVEENPAE